MRRREFLVATATLGALSRPALAQQSARMKRVAMLDFALDPEDMKVGADSEYAIILEEMLRRGYAEGSNLIIDRYSAGGRPSRFAEISRQAVAIKPDAIYAADTDLVLALQPETDSIPIVALMSEPVAVGIVDSLYRPRGNITGLNVTVGLEIYAERVELLLQAVGKLSNARLLVNDVEVDWSRAAKATKEAFDRLEIPYQLERLAPPYDHGEYRRAFNAMQHDKVDGVVISAGIDTYPNRCLLGRLAREYCLPAIGNEFDMVKAGALISHSPDRKAEARQIGAQIVEILNGRSPADMPILRATHFELSINLKTAKELGLHIPPELVARCDRVIN